MRRATWFLIISALASAVGADTGANAGPYLIEAIAERRQAPAFPLTARTYGADGAVDLRFKIDRLGRVADLEVVSASGHPSYRGAALASVKRWHFEPAYDVGECRRYARVVEQRISFRRDAKGVGIVELTPMRLASVPGDPAPLLVADKESIVAELLARDIVIETVNARHAKTLSRRAPVLPAAALAGRLTGFATGRLVIAPDGSPTEVKIVDSEPRGVYGPVTQEAMLRWRFEPLPEGAPVVPRVVCQTFNFEFERTPKPEQSDEVPHPTRTPMPQFPLAFQRNPKAVQARVAGMVDAKGVPYDIHIVYSDPPGVLEDYLLRAVAKWRFEPAKLDGKPVAAPFERDFTYDPRNWRQWERASYLQGVDGEDVERLHELYPRVRSLCPDEFPRSDDAVNRVLKQVSLDGKTLAESLPDDPRSAFEQFPAVGACLFSSWEQFRDPEVLQAAQEFVGPSAPVRFGGTYVGLQQMRERLLQAPMEPTRFDTPELKTLLRYFAGQLMPVYRHLLQEWSDSQPSFPVPTPKAQAALDVVRATPETKYDHRVISVLQEAIKASESPLDRAYLSISLSKVQFRLGHGPDAIAILDRLGEDQTLPAPLRGAARVSLLAFASSMRREEPDYAAISRAMNGLNSDLGVQRQLTL